MSTNEATKTEVEAVKTENLPEKAPEAKKQEAAPVVDNGEFGVYFDSAKFNQAYRAAVLLSKADIVPAQYRGKPENCFVALQMATRMQVDPFMFMQNTYIVQGKPGMEAKLAIALMNQRGPFRGPVQWSWTGKAGTEDWTCTAWAVHSRTGEKCSASVSWRMAVAEGWTTKSGTKWKTMPEQMFMYRSAMFLARLYCPEVLMGMPTTDELVETGDRPAYEIIDMNTVDKSASRTADLVGRLTQSAADEPAPSEAPVSAKAVADKLRKKDSGKVTPTPGGNVCPACGEDLGDATSCECGFGKVE
jgi:hypothetical protein